MLFSNYYRYLKKNKELRILILHWNKTFILQTLMAYPAPTHPISRSAINMWFLTLVKVDSASVNLWSYQSSRLPHVERKKNHQIVYFNNHLLSYNNVMFSFFHIYSLQTIHIHKICCLSLPLFPIFSPPHLYPLFL